jgi:hypothetical protein
VLDPENDYRPATCLYANPDKIWKLYSDANLLCEGISVGPYQWVDRCSNCSGYPALQFGELDDSTGQMQWHNSFLNTQESWVWIRFQYNMPDGPVPEPGDSTAHIRVRVTYPGNTSPTVRGPADTCGVKNLYLPVYWSRCQSPCADSTCTDCCTGPTVGNLDGSPENYLTMGDLAVLIDHLFGTLQPLACPSAGNLDRSPDGLVTMGDLTVMIDHLFINLDPVPPCPY